MIEYQNNWFYIVRENSQYYLTEPKAKNAAALLLRCEEKFVLVSQYRPAIHQSSLEIPRGYAEVNETNVDCAIRETHEETGIRVKPDELQFLGYIYPNNGIISSKISLFFANTKSKFISDFYSKETSKCISVSFDKISDMIENNEITDSFTLSAFAIFIAKKY